MIARPQRDIDPGDARTLRGVLRRGSKSFYAASWLLPPRVRAPVTALYAFCRHGDDAVDNTRSPTAGLERIAARLEAVYAGRPANTPVDRAFAAVVERYAIPRAVPDALLEGFRWDVEGRRYETMAELQAYAARVASTVGVMMTLIMDRREPETLARACELGLAMQLTNIARDVGEDGRDGRIYLPLQWLREAGIEPDLWLSAPNFSPELGTVVARVLDHADWLYARADVGITMLPADCQPAIRAARHIYADIGRVIRDAGLDSVSRRAYTTVGRKLGLVLGSLLVPSPDNRPENMVLPPLTATRFLVEVAR